MRGRAARMPCLAGIVAAIVAGCTQSPQPSVRPAILRVGTYDGVAGQFSDIHSALRVARPGDWVLIAPGDYREAGSTDPRLPAGVPVRTPHLRLRGMDRNAVFIDGTRSGSVPCPSQPDAQEPGPRDGAGNPLGRNGIEVDRVDGVSVENMTVCNFLGGAGGKNGNQVWWNGGDGSGRIGMAGLAGSYLTATSTYYEAGRPAAMYGIFAVNERGPATIAHTYASNFAVSAYYVGACRDCNLVLTDAHAQNSAEGFSATNAGGHLVVERSEWDLNAAGIVPNSYNNEDVPSPQDGACPGRGTGPTGSHSCTLILDNYVHDNNNPNVPHEARTATRAVGVGIELVGSENDTVTGNRVARNGAWGILVHDNPDAEPPPPAAHCTGGQHLDPTLCYFVAFGNEVAHNVLEGNGSFGNDGNGDLALSSQLHAPGNCFHDNTDPGGLSSSPPRIQTVMGSCGNPNGTTDLSVLQELRCASVIAPRCIGPGQYPRQVAVRLLPIPQEPSMPNPCAGVPRNPWCPRA